MRDNVRSLSLRTSDRCHDKQGSRHAFLARRVGVAIRISLPQTYMQFEKETDSHASVATLARNDGGGLNNYPILVILSAAKDLLSVYAAQIYC